ncbi:MAG: NADH-quinone oxidoreductase subunit J [Planctomycetales bacterium]|nr:NADH-quinone oxidoreductase subunit J [Planctomycetales bacterium]
MNDTPASDAAVSAVEATAQTFDRGDVGWIAVAVVTGTLGLWLLLPPSGAKRRLSGMVLMIAALAVLGAARLIPVGDWGYDAMYAVLSGLTVVAAVSTVTFRNPVYCAIWFALTLLGIAGLFLIDGAQFLGVAIVVVYAGAILVMFLFVLMLANPSGRAAYDRLSWEPWIAAPVGVLLVAIVTLTYHQAFDTGDTAPLPSASTEALADGVLANQHVARLGNQLFGRYLVDVEVAGVLLLVALVAASAIVAAAPGEPNNSKRAARGERP